MELQDVKNKALTTASVATVAVATSTAPVLAHSNPSASGSNYQPTSQTSTTTDKDDCKPEATQQPKPDPTPAPTPTTAPTQPTETPAPVTPATPATSAPVTPAADETPATPAPATTPAAAETPEKLPNAGPGSLVAPVAAVGFTGYLASLFHLKRKNKKAQI